MTTREALLRAVLATPEDDLPRLVMADHLDEIGEAKLAEFVRVQIELEKIDPHAKCDGYYCQTYDTGNTMHVDCRGERLRNRERELWGSWPDTDDMRTHFHTQIGGHGPPTEWIILPWSLRGGSDGERSMYVRRGWISAVRCRLEDWIGGEMCPRCEGDGVSLVSDYHRMRNCRHCSGTGRTTGIGPRLVREHPVEVVRVVDRVAANIDSPMKFAWHTATEWRNVPHHIPPAVWSNLKGGDRCANCPYCWGYPTRDAADAALSAALIAWAKSQGVGDE